jgi:hypothetical protein
MALGARSSDVVGHVLRDASKLVLIGLFIGSAGAFALTRLAKALLFGVSPLDPVAFVIACAGNGIVVLGNRIRTITDDEREREPL